jgi:hypothetical protein
MTPDELFNYFWDKYQETYEEQKTKGNPITQPELYKTALTKTVNEALKRESTKQAEEYLKKSEVLINNNKKIR